MPPIEPDIPPVPESAVVPTLLPVARVVAPPAEADFEYVDDAPPRRVRPTPAMALWVRIALVLMAVVFVALLTTAAVLNPYAEDGAARKNATHTQLGLQPCSMIVMWGKPCPACGMTTSFSLLMHGDVWNSLQANWVGTLLAAGLAVLAPWGVASALRGKLLWVRNGELFATILLCTLLVLMFSRWLYVLFGKNGS